MLIYFIFVGADSDPCQSATKMAYNGKRASPLMAAQSNDCLMAKRRKLQQKKRKRLPFSDQRERLPFSER